MIESKYLQANMQNVQKLMVIPGLNRFDIEHLEVLLKRSKIRQYEDGETIIQEGANDRWLYFLLSGSVIIKKDGVEFSTIDQEGEILGEMSLIEGTTRSSSVIAKGKAVCLAVDNSTAEGLSSDEQENGSYLIILYKIFSESLSSRLQLRTNELVLVKRENEKLRKIVQKLRRQ